MRNSVYGNSLQTCSVTTNLCYDEHFLMVFGRFLVMELGCRSGNTKYGRHEQFVVWDWFKEYYHKHCDHHESGLPSSQGREDSNYGRPGGADFLHSMTKSWYCGKKYEYYDKILCSAGHGDNLGLKPLQASCLDSTGYRHDKTYNCAKMNFYWWIDYIKD